MTLGTTAAINYARDILSNRVNAIGESLSRKLSKPSQQKREQLICERSNLQAIINSMEGCL
jgi:hypothetical protein